MGLNKNKNYKVNLVIKIIRMIWEIVRLLKQNKI